MRTVEVFTTLFLLFMGLLFQDFSPSSMISELLLRLCHQAPFSPSYSWKSLVFLFDCSATNSSNIILVKYHPLDDITPIVVDGSIFYDPLWRLPRKRTFLSPEPLVPL